MNASHTERVLIVVCLEKTHPEGYCLRRPFPIAAAAATHVHRCDPAVAVTLRRHIEVMCTATYQRCRGAIQRRPGLFMAPVADPVAAGGAAPVAAGATALNGHIIIRTV